MSLGYLPAGEMSDPDDIDIPPNDQKSGNRGRRQGSTSAQTNNQASGIGKGKPFVQTTHQRDGSGQGKKNRLISSGEHTTAGRATSQTDGDEQGDTSVRTTGKTSDNREKTRDNSRERKETFNVRIAKHLERTWIIYILVLVLVIQQYQLGNIKSTIETIETKGTAIDLSPYVEVSLYNTNNKDVSKTISNLQEDITDAERSIEGLDTYVKSAKLEFQKQSDELRKQTDAIPGLNDNLKDLEGRLQDYDKWTSKVENLLTDISTISEEFRQTRDDFNKFKAILGEEAHHLREDVEHTKQEYSQFVQVMNEDHIPRLKDARAQLDEFNKQFEEIKGKVNEVLMPNAFNKAAVLQAFMVLAVLLIMLILYMKKQPAGPGNQIYPAHNQPAEGENPEEVSPDIYRIPPNQTLQSMICVVSFDEETQRQHEVIVKQIISHLPKNGLTFRPPRVMYEIVRAHEDIVKLPPSKLYLMFADFSERHVIIEQPGLGLGDNRRTTVQAFKRLQADFVIIYYRDLESKQLPPSSRFNRNIYCVGSQDTLIKVNRYGRFFSVFEKLNEFQLNCLRAIITDVFTE